MYSVLKPYNVRCTHRLLYQYVDIGADRLNTTHLHLDRSDVEFVGVADVWGLAVLRY